MEEVKHENNVYALDIKNIVRHISEVESGKKGYYCLGCGREMQAKKGDKRAQHFAHDPKDVLNKGKCTYSDETYRHQLAKEILQRIRQVKVPPVYKYPPQGIEGKPYKLRGAEFISAETVKIELTFFEDVEGSITYGRDVNIDSGSDKFLLIRPDVTFFDKSENPILLIEIVATHKITAEKLSKIKKLGIDTIQVTIPKDSPEEIESAFFKTTRTQWVYNYEQEQAAYLPTSQGDSEGISSLDEFQRKLLETAESYECRSSQINNLIRGLNKCLESQSYTDSKRYLGEEIQRVEINTERHRERLRELQEGHKRAIEEEFKLQMEDVAAEERGIGEKSRVHDEEVKDYETRYNRKREELSRLQRDYRAECQDEIDRIEKEFERLGTNANNFRRRIDEIRREEINLDQRYRDQIRRFEEETRSEEDGIADIRQRTIDLPGKYVEIEARIRAEFEGKANKAQRDFEDGIRNVREKFERLGREIIDAVEGRNCSGVSDSRMERRIRSVFETRQRLETLSKRKVDLARLRKYKEIFDNGAYKT